MNYKIISTDLFKKQAKRLCKKFRSLPDELRKLALLLSVNPTSGVNLGHNTYKIRISIQSKGKGKRGGARIITFVVTIDEEVYLLTIYDKSDIESISDEKISEIIKMIRK
jgi:mRNA-degrading endonuclease RelE of RelBE toxin-antitoxin system